MIVKPDISAEEFVRRIPFMKKFKNVSNEHWTHLTKLDENYDVKMTMKDEILHFKQVNTNIEFIYYKDKINDNYFYHFIIKYQLLLTQPEGMSDFSWTVLIHVNSSQNDALSFNKKIMSQNETLSDEELSKMINELNGHFFKIDDYLNNLNTNIQNPLNESNIKTLIKEHLHRLVENGYKIVPQDYGAEFRQTGSGKSMIGLSNKEVISDKKLNQVMAQLALAKEISLKYKRAWEKGEEGIFVFWMGKKMLMRIPKELRTATDPNGRPVDYSNYFNIPTLGDGGFQYRLFRNGDIVGGVVQSRPEMTDRPDLGSAVDAGYNKDYDDRLKYFFVKAGIMGKYQEEAGRFASILDTPAIDASIKVRVIFHDEILDFLTKDKGKAQYTADKKGAAIANSMEFEKKLEKIRKDAEIAIGKPVYGSTTWMDFKDKLKTDFDTPEKQQAMDINQMTKEFISRYQEANTVLYKGKQQITMAPDEEAEWEKQQKEKLQRIAAAKARMKK